MRKLASVRKISAIDPIEGADKIVCASVDGWKLVTAKDNGFNVGDLVIYFEIDSFLPVREEFEFLRPKCFKSTKNLGDGFRLKTIKLKGQVSQGLIMPLSILKTETPLEALQEGDDLTELLGIQKYEKPIPAHLVGKVKGIFPSFLKKTDQERAQNITRDIIFRLYDHYELTMKLDGSSMTVYYKDDEHLGVCSRNLDLYETDENLFWQVNNKFKILESLKIYCTKTNQALALQGELMGPGVQNNREQLKDHQFYLFDIWDINASKYLPPLERESVWKNLRSSTEIKIDRVPFINDIMLADHVNPNTLIDDLLKLVDIPSINNKIPAEGIVFRNHHRDFTFKVINNKFLLEEKD